MGYIFEASGGFHYRAYSTVDIVTGKPLCVVDGQGRRVQQSVLIARKDSAHTSKTCVRVQELAVAKAREIEAWGIRRGLARPRPRLRQIYGRL